MKSRIKKISAQWFRGFSDQREVELSDKSLAVYGENGSGKSSFVDVVEYIVRSGKIEHLRHEYSGTRQERGIVNTHKPNDGECRIKITLKDATEVEAVIAPNGSFTIVPDNNDLSVLEYQRVILRQDEVADFIKETKGEKYSSLLPLLGLGHLELAIENLKKVEKSVKEQSQLDYKKGEVREIQDLAKTKFGAGMPGRDALYSELEKLFKKYCPSETYDSKTEPEKAVGQILEALKVKINAQTKEQATFNDLKSVSVLDLKSLIGDVKTTSIKLASSSEVFIAEKIDVLSKASAFVNKVADGVDVECPACGTEVASSDFKKHVKDEYARLKDALQDFDAYKKSVNSFADSLQALKNLMSKSSLDEWKKQLDVKSVGYLVGLNVTALRSKCEDTDLKDVETNLDPLIQDAVGVVKQAPPEVSELVADKESIDLIRRFVEAKQTTLYIQKIEALVNLILEIQSSLRERIKTQSSTSISAISDDIARMWGILHPEESIEGVHLYLPADQDKAIEIGLKFYGIDQESPRLTLSEGHRNSLGLCIFLAMAKNGGNQEVPIILDDVVVSFDRNHRGRVANLLEQELKDRQIILFTHDREWFIELKHLLDASHWDFKALMPWVNPATGIRWSSKDTTFDDAREQLEADPDVAGNTTRKIMDISLALIAEKLHLKLPYLHREKNDHRVSHEFLTEIISVAGKCFETKRGTAYAINQSAIDALKEADKQLIARGNRSSHTFSMTKTEANDLIDKCEIAVRSFTCPSCSKPVTKMDDSGAELVQCECGQLRWRYGKV